MNSFQVIIARHSDGYVAYPVGLNGVVVGDGNTVEEALANVESAIRFHLETFGEDACATLASARRKTHTGEGTGRAPGGHRAYNTCRFSRKSCRPRALTRQARRF